MQKPERCKNSKCFECKVIKFCVDHKVYENKLDEALARQDIPAARQIIREWENIKIFGE